MLFFKKASPPAIDHDHPPRHIAIIMDGNGRWAEQRRLPRSGGHAAGAEAFRKVAAWAKEMGIHCLTVYAFSTENWRRPREEVEAIMGLLKRYLQEALRDMEKNRVHMTFLGDLSPLEGELRDLCRQVEEVSARYGEYRVNICLNYGARDEILHAARAYAADCAAGKADPGVLTEADFSNYLYTRGIPDPDLIIRPGAEQRLSNFLLWQAAYAELYFTDVCWPDFKKEDLIEAVAAFQRRRRRFGGT